MLLLTLSMRLGLNALTFLNPSFGSRYVFFSRNLYSEYHFFFGFLLNFANGISLMLLVVVHGSCVRF